MLVIMGLYLVLCGKREEARAIATAATAKTVQATRGNVDVEPQERV